jgi:hypothetical protein
MPKYVYNPNEHPYYKNGESPFDRSSEMICMEIWIKITTSKDSQYLTPGPRTASSITVYGERYGNYLSNLHSIENFIESSNKSERRNNYYLLIDKRDTGLTYYDTTLIFSKSLLDIASNNGNKIYDSGNDLVYLFPITFLQSQQFEQPY